MSSASSLFQQKGEDEEEKVGKEDGIFGSRSVQV